MKSCCIICRLRRPRNFVDVENPERMAPSPLGFRAGTNSRVYQGQGCPIVAPSHLTILSLQLAWKKSGCNPNISVLRIVVHDQSFRSIDHPCRHRGSGWG
jgi:hypothetical protein